MKLIDADALEEKLDKIPARRIENADGRAYVLIRLSTVFEIIKQMPPAQPEQKKGEWLRYGEDGYPNNEDTVFWQCDQCLEQYTGRTKRIPNYCPNCGAYMKGGAI